MTQDLAPWLDRIGSFVERTAGFWVKMAALESSSHRDALDRIAIDRPLYVTGLARSGSTILLEILAGHPAVATHRYRDYPPIYTPIFWNRAFARIYKDDAPVERAHKDRIQVTPDSPEAMEEMVWMRFFAHRHDPEVSQVLDRATSNPAFETFYRDHIRKILLIRGGSRYLAKANYSITRLAYLQKLFPDARFIVPVREPRMHIASLAKQHRLFATLEAQDPRVLHYMQRVGHFEFGLDRRPICVGDPARARSIQDLWRSGQDVRGLARQWSSVYGFLLDQMASDPALAAAVKLVRYEWMCARGVEAVGQILAHAGLELSPDRLAAEAARLSMPTYYAPDFTPEEEDAIREETAVTAGRLGYEWPVEVD